jgi:deoxyribonuclease II
MNRTFIRHQFLSIWKRELLTSVETDFKMSISLRIYPELTEALEMNPIKTPPFYNIATLQSRDGTNFLSFAKSRKFQKELYEDLVAPTYNAGDYYVESWRHGRGNIESDCSKPSKVYNIEQVKFKSANITFKTMQDHSKWMVSEEHDLICVGDINRQVT